MALVREVRIVAAKTQPVYYYKDTQDVSYNQTNPEYSLRVGGKQATSELTRDVLPLHDSCLK